MHYRLFAHGSVYVWLLGTTWIKFYNKQNALPFFISLKSGNKFFTSILSFWFWQFEKIEKNWHMQCFLKYQDFFYVNIFLWVKYHNIILYIKLIVQNSFEKLHRILKIKWYVKCFILLRETCVEVSRTLIACTGVWYDRSTQ